MVFLRTHQPYSGTEVLMETKLERIAEISANSPRPEFTSLYHLINKEMLLQCHKELDGNKAVGMDEITKKEYERNLEQNIDDLVIVQLALKKILEAIYEPRFLNCMYGFRPNRGCHNAIKELYKRLNNTKICYIVDADIKGFFDHMKHEWIIKFLKLYIKDPNIIGLVKKYLKVGVLDNGELMVNEEGSAQGNIISPILANIYMHNVLTLWYKFIITKECKGDNFLIVYADDFVAGFQYKWEAENYYKLLKERMEKFGLQLEDSKSRLLQSGAYIARAKQKSGECIRLQTFDFLGFTFYCSKTRKGGFVPKVQTSRKKFEQKVRAYKNWIYDNRNRPMREIIKELNVKLIGHYRYYGVTWNFRKITTFLHRVQHFLFKAMNRRGCRRAYTWNGFVEMLKYYPLAKPKTYYCLY